jgi:HEAT repeat protein
MADGKKRLRAMTHKKTRRRPSIEKQIESLREIAAKDKKAFVNSVPAALSARNPAVRETAIALIMEHEVKDAAQLIEPLLNDQNDNVRYSAAECIGLLNEGRGTNFPSLRRLLRDPARLVRVQAVESVGLVGDRGALPAVVRLLSDKDPIVRSYASSTVGALRGSSYLNKLRHALMIEKQNLARVGFYEALFQLGQRKVLPDMLKLLGSSDYHVRCGIANTLERMSLSPSENDLAVKALTVAAQKPIAVADETTTKRVLRTLRASLDPKLQ